MHNARCLMRDVGRGYGRSAALYYTVLYYAVPSPAAQIYIPQIEERARMRDSGWPSRRERARKFDWRKEAAMLFFESVYYYFVGVGVVEGSG